MEQEVYFLKEMKYNDLINEKHKKVGRALNYFGYFLIFVSAFIGCVSVDAFASLFGVSVGITSSAVGLKLCALTAGIKKYKLIIKNKRKIHNKIVF